MKEMTLREVNELIEGLEALAVCIDDTTQGLLNWLSLSFNDEARSIVKRAIDQRNAFYELPFEERLLKAGFRKNAEGNLEKSIEL